MVMLNLTKEEARYIFNIMMVQQVDGDELASKIMDKIPLRVL